MSSSSLRRGHSRVSKLSGVQESRLRLRACVNGAPGGAGAAALATGAGLVSAGHAGPGVRAARCGDARHAADAAGLVGVTGAAVGEFASAAEAAGRRAGPGARGAGQRGGGRHARHHLRRDGLARARGRQGPGRAERGGLKRSCAPEGAASATRPAPRDAATEAWPEGRAALKQVHTPAHAQRPRMARRWARAGSDRRGAPAAERSGSEAKHADVRTHAGKRSRVPGLRGPGSSIRHSGGFRWQGCTAKLEGELPQQGPRGCLACFLTGRRGADFHFLGMAGGTGPSPQIARFFEGGCSCAARCGEMLALACRPQSIAVRPREGKGVRAARSTSESGSAAFASATRISIAMPCACRCPRAAQCGRIRSGAALHIMVVHLHVHAPTTESFSPSAAAAACPTTPLATQPNTDLARVAASSKIDCRLGPGPQASGRRTASWAAPSTGRRQGSAAPSSRHIASHRNRCRRGGTAEGGGEELKSRGGRKRAGQLHRSLDCSPG